MVGDYLHFAGWKGVEVVEVSDGRVDHDQGREEGEGGLQALFRGMGMAAGGRRDPLWVVRGVNEG